MFPHFVLSFISAFLLASFVAAQSIVIPTTAAASATAVASASGYTYAGCYNETTGFSNTNGLRALSDASEATNTMTVDICLQYCSKADNGTAYTYAGIEYGRECYCGQYLSALSTQLNDTARCIYGCNGNGSEICGGALALSVYNLTSTSKKGMAWSMVSAQPTWYGVAAIATLIVAAVL